MRRPALTTSHMLRAAIGVLLAWIGIDYALLRDLSPFYSYYGTFSPGTIDDLLGTLLLAGAIGILAGPYVQRSSAIERFGYLAASLGCILHGLGFALMQVARWLDAPTPTQPVPLSWFSQLGTGMFAILLGLLLGRIATWPELRR